MSKIAVFGSGMMGKALAGMIAGDIIFMDNKKGNVEEVISSGVDTVVLGVLDDERQTQMKNQLNKLEYTGEIETYPTIFDNRIATLRLLAEQIPDGDVAELGVYKGDFAMEIERALPGRKMHLFDSFEGFDGMFKDTSEEYVASRLPNALIHKGYFPSTFEAHEYAFISLDADLYEPTRDGLALFWPCMVKNSVIMVHDYNSTQFPGVKKAVDEFCEKYDILPFPVCDLHGSVVLRK